MKVSQSNRLFKLREVFTEYTDEDHALDIKEIERLLKLDAKGNEELSLSAAVIRRDIQKLIDSAFDIIREAAAHNRHTYKHIARLFENYELQMLLDAVSSTRCI
jgi:hypothetical protein